MTLPSIRVGAPLGTAHPAGAGRGLGRNTVKALVVEKLALVDATDVPEIERAMEQSGGNITIDSQQAVTIIAMLGQHLGCTLPGPADLHPHEYASVESLTSLVERALG